MSLFALRWNGMVVQLIMAYITYGNSIKNEILYKRTTWTDGTL